MPSNETLNGTVENDEINGQDGSDVIDGGYGDDRLDGGSGNDVLDGGRGSDLLLGGAGDDTLISDSDAGEPEIAQDYDPNAGRNDEIDPATRRLYPDQPFVADDILVGGEGADTFLIKPQINAKADIIAKHTDDDGRIDWADVAGENNNAHDHWVDSIGTDVIADYDKAEGDRILLYGHTVDPEISYADVDGDGDEESIIRIYSNQGAGGGAHNGDFLGQMIVHGDRVEEADIQIKAMETYGVVETVDEMMEAVAPTGTRDQDVNSTASENPFLSDVDTRDPGENPGSAFVENVLLRETTDAADDTISGTGGNDVLEGDPAQAAVSSLDAPLSYWTLSPGGSGILADARGVSDAQYYLQDNDEASLQTAVPMMPGPDGESAALFGVSGKTFAYAAHNESYEVLNATLTAWFNPVDLGGSQTILAKDESSADGGGHFHIRVDGEGQLFIRLAEGEGKNDAGYNHEWRSNENLIREGNWQHVAISFGAAGVAVYLNGEALADSQFTKVAGDPEVSLSEFEGAYLIGNDKPLIIGANTRVSNDTSTAEALGVDDRLTQFFEGAISDVGLWGGDTPADALSAEQIADLYANGPGDLSTAAAAAAPAIPVGDDTISGGSGDDVIDGGAGDDVLDGGAGDDTLLGGYGSDTLSGGGDADTLDGGHGEDTLDGGAGNDTVISRADDREPEIAQDFDRSDDPDYEIDFDARMIYPSQADMASDDTLAGGAGADSFVFETLINAKQHIINRHVNDDRTIDWMGVAGENNNVHDHWVDGIGNDTITDFNQAEGDTISIAGHTTEVYRIDNVDADGDGDTDTVLHLRSNQGAGGGAHNLDLLGTVTVLDNALDAGDFTVNAGVAYGIVETIDEYREAITPLMGAASDTPAGEADSTVPPLDETAPDADPDAAPEPETQEPEAETESEPQQEAQPEPEVETSPEQQSPPAAEPQAGLFAALMSMPAGIELSTQPTSGDDILAGSGSSDRIRAGEGDDLVLGGDGNDRLDGNAGADRISGGAGNDRAMAGLGDDIVDGNAGEDNLRGGQGDDILLGGIGSDTVDGGQGDDVIIGGAGGDRLKGGSGNDLIYDAHGADRINGGRGTDVLALDGSIDDYTIDVRNGRLKIEDADGMIDQVKGVEFVRFAGSGETYAVEQSELSAAADTAMTDAMFDDQLIGELIGGASVTAEQASQAELQAVDLAAVADSGADPAPASDGAIALMLATLQADANASEADSDSFGIL